MQELTIRTPQTLWSALYLEDSAGNWLPPPTPSVAMLAQARAILADFPGRLQLASIDDKRKWLLSLAALCAGKMPLEEARTRITLYAEMFDHPKGCFTKGTLQTIGATFAWFPSFADLKAALDAERIRLGKMHARLQRLLAPPAIRPAPRVPPTPEQIQRVQQAIYEAGFLSDTTHA